MPSEIVLFQISGTIGTILFYLFYEILYRTISFEQYKATFCWLFAYSVSILWQTELHSRIVFKTKIQNYPKTFLQTYIAYGLSIFLSTVINSLLVDFIGINHQVAWISTLIGTGVLNYFTVSNIMKPKEK